jgi:hypothetical protein
LGFADAASVAADDDESPILFLYCGWCLQLCLPSGRLNSVGQLIFSHWPQGF